MKNRLIPILILSLSFNSCKDFIETALDEKIVTVTAPADNAFTTSATVYFYWEELDGARNYHLQIVKPSFSNITQMITDTTVTGTNFAYVLVPGTYQWRIRAQNGSSETVYTTHTLTIDSTTDLSSQTIILFRPTENDATKTGSVTFSCYPLYNASHYRWALKTHASGFNGTLVLPEKLEGDTSITVTGLSEGYYDWGMRGETSLSSTLYASRSIYIDFTAPSAPTLSTPADGNTASGPSFNLSWAHAADTGSPLYDSVYIYSNASLTNTRRSYKVSSGTSVSDTLSNGTYYWRVKTIDKAGNTSGFSSTRWFKLM